MTTLYGIKNCDTIKKARHWLEQHQISYQFVDYRTDGLSMALLQQFADACGWQQLLNTRGTTFRQLDDSDKSDLTEQKALALMLAQPAMIKRPLLVHKGEHHLGFKPEIYQQIFGLAA
ncbi:MAG: ArsC family reductase [Gammaproteobacteria bacterium]|nr:ArsC family reductase [Gammaproteobacteria bacterium]MBU1553647.1 ArsC family reductase [Gammaproteobacteria bacterium]MBU2070162.1 ArsC family reductase [Gammaproteobacteria bacterium]MBU2183587.1 ArsC family reductase [Gammaproteobacteria bacterium]MBU2204738.1 ArsC family reductase [Gammaproteobacteria bacterium]